MMGGAFTQLTMTNAWKLVLLALCLETANAWSPAVVRRAVATASLSGILCTGLTAGAVDFTGSYSDPNHPNCLRAISNGAENMVRVTGTDGNPGCPVDGSGREWALTGMVSGSTIQVDFSPKGGPRDLQGVYDESGTPGIRWPDGNKWSLIASPK